MWRRVAVCGTVGVALTAIAVACSSSTSGDHGPGDGGTGGYGFEGGFQTGDGGQTTLRITPSTATVTVTPGKGAVPTVDFDVSGVPSGERPYYRVVNRSAGTIDDNGVFTPSGKFAGVVEIQVVVGDQTLTATVTIDIKHREVGGPQSTAGDIGPGGLYGVGGEGFGRVPSDDVIAVLEGTPAADSALSFLYPYDDTVFPLGVLPPLLMWNNGTSRNFEAVYIRLSTGSHYEYKGFFGRPTLLGNGSLVRHPIPREVWDTATQSAAGKELTLEVVLAAGGKAYGPIKQTWNIAVAPVKGTIYYQAYGTELAKNLGQRDFNGERFGGATLSIGIGDEGPALVAGFDSDNGEGCRVCHSVSAYGDRMVVQHGNEHYTTSAIDLKNGNTETTPYQDGTVGWAGMYPDGTIGLANSIEVTAVNDANNGDTALYDMETGAVIPSPGLSDFATRIALPAFSHDGERVTFTFFEGPSTDGVGAADGRKLVGMTFDLATMSFTDPVLLWDPAAEMLEGRSAFPTFMTSSRGVVFQRKWGGPGNEPFGTRQGGRGELWWVDFDTKQAALLDRANGIGADGERYVPTADNDHQADDELNYEPSISPVASGGYAWMVFMSRRLYGNVGVMGPWESDPREHNLRDNVTTKKIWMAAIDLNATPGKDPSHPAFYIPGQEIHGVNSRPFFALDPCVTDTGVCSTGVDCCSGFCEDGFCAPQNEDECSDIDEKCEAASDCCGTGVQCIGGFCAVIIK